MKTLLCSKPSPLHLPKPSQLWNPRSPILRFLTIQNLNHPTRIKKLHANAKGFNSRPATIKESATNKKNEDEDEDEDEDEPLPQVVFERMIVRILVSVGVPMAIGVAILQVLGLVKEQNLWDVPLWLPFFTTLLTFGASTLGIAYGSLSTSWDAEKKGSILGLEEAQQNWVEMWREENNS